MPEPVAPLLDVRELTLELDTEDGVITPVDGLNITIHNGERVGLAGESGSGKTLTGRSLTRLLPSGISRMSGEVLFDGADIALMSEGELRRIRGAEIGMVFQDPMTFLNPTMRVGAQIEEAIEASWNGTGPIPWTPLELVRTVGLGGDAGLLRRYPHELSGGMRQRVLMAVALAGRPRLVIADEPTTALDVTVQAQLMKQLMILSDDLDTAVLLITHDLGLIAEFCQRVYIMYAGQIVEEATVDTLFDRPAHPYTKALLDTIMTVEERTEVIAPIPGTVPNPLRMPEGCRFRPRCSYAFDQCVVDPPWVALPSHQGTRCWLSDPGSRPGATSDQPLTRTRRS